MYLLLWFLSKVVVNGDNQRFATRIQHDHVNPVLPPLAALRMENPMQQLWPRVRNNTQRRKVVAVSKLPLLKIVRPNALAEYLHRVHIFSSNVVLVAVLQCMGSFPPISLSF